MLGRAALLQLVFLGQRDLTRYSTCDGPERASQTPNREPKKSTGHKTQHGMFLSPDGGVSLQQPNRQE